MRTIHAETCTRIFKRYDLTCPRCQELAAGQPARAGWNDLNVQQAAQQVEAIRHHDFVACARQNVVCTHFEY